MKRGKICAKCGKDFKRGDAWMGSAGIALHMKCPGEEKTNLDKAIEKLDQKEKK